MLFLYRLLHCLINIFILLRLYSFYRETFNKVKLEGLDPQKMYKIKEINLMPGTQSGFADDGKVISGNYLMKYGLTVSGNVPLTSAVFEITEEK
ncbi:MAG TPA: GH36 C-terminal domain-containing protein [Mucilaginibacter sp.]